MGLCRFCPLSYVGPCSGVERACGNDEPRFAFRTPTISYAADITSRANGVLLPLCSSAAATCDYDLNVYNYTNLAVHLVIDVTGYLATPGPSSEKRC